MTDKIDQVSKLLGALQADIHHIKKVSDDTNKSLHQQKEQLLKNKFSVNTAHKRLDDHNMVIEDYKKIKQRAFGIVSIIGMMSGFLATAGLKVLGKFIG